MKCGVLVCLVVLAVCVQGIPMYELNSAVKITKPQQNGNLVELAESLGLTRLVEEAKKVGIANVFETTPELTLFGPTNEAFENVPEPIKPLISNVTVLRAVLLFHGVKGKVYANAIKNELLLPSIMEGARKFFIRFNVYGEIVTAQCAKIIQVNQNASNGALHVLSGVMMPANASVTDMVSQYQQWFGIIFKALVRTKLDKVLSGEGPFTVFVPSNDAWTRIPAAELKKIFENIPLLTEIVKYHVVAGTLCRAGLSDGAKLPTLEGSDVEVHISNWVVSVNNANVVYADSVTTNGVVHVIDAVLFPKDFNRVEL